MNKTKIFVSAYACEPNLGSEIGVGWNWVLEMSRYFELWVLTRKSNQSSIEKWMEESKLKFDIHFIFWDLPKKLRFWKRGLRGVRIYYIIWQRLTNDIVKKVMQQNNIDIYHLLTYGNSLWPASKYGMSKYFIWGPTGGVDSIPFEYIKHYTFKWKLIEMLRRATVKMLPFNMGFQTRCKKANLILCKSYSLLENIPEKYRNKAVLFTDVAVELKDSDKYLASRNKSNNLIRYLAVGRMDAWRGFDILVEAFNEAVKKNSDLHLDIVGDGSDFNRITTLVKKLKADCYITLSGKISIEEYYMKMADCDVVVNSCLKEGAVTTAFDALAFGKPLIGIDTGGYTRYFKPEYSIIIPRGARKRTVEALRDSILELSDEKVRTELSSKGREISKSYTWEHKGREIFNTLSNCI